MSADKIHIPPIKTQGIKTKLVPSIKSVALMTSETRWIEPFMGSGVVGLNIAPKKALFSDTNPHIVKFYNSLKTKELSSEVIAAYLVEEGAKLARDGEGHYYKIRKRFNESHSALDFLFLNRSCFNGMIRFNKQSEFNVPFCRKVNRFSRAYITKIVNQVKYFEGKIWENDWVFLCQPFEKTLACADENCLIYCDPPYIGRHVDYYDSWNEDQEKALNRTLLSTTAKYVLSTWDYNCYRKNPYIASLWGGCHKLNKEHFYHVGARETNRNIMVEALLMNYPPMDHKEHIHGEETAYRQLKLDIPLYPMDGEPPRAGALGEG